MNILNKKTVLIVDDNKAIGELLHAVMESGGFSVCWCDNGLTALELSNRRQFQVIITDYQMKGLDGVFLTKALRLQNPDSLIIGMSAEHKRRDFLEAGADEFFMKPFLFGDLIRCIQRKLES